MEILTDDIRAMGERLTRRGFLSRSGAGLGSVALGLLLEPKRLWSAERPTVADTWRGVVQPLHFPARVKRVIHLYQAGGPSHLDLFDAKPKLRQMDGQPMPESFTRGQPIAQLQGQKLRCFGPQHSFQRWGRSGQEISVLLPQIGSIADEICIVRSMQTEQINHDPAHTFMNTGTQISGRPSAGSWIWYGIGAEAEDLPGFVVLTSHGRGGQMQPIAARQWHSGFLPSRFQGVHFLSKGDAVLYLRDPDGEKRKQKRKKKKKEAKKKRNKTNRLEDPEVSARLSQYEMAFRMQTSIPSLTDFAGEPRHVLDSYGVERMDG